MSEKKIVVAAVDDSPSNRRVLDEALAIAGSGEVHIVHVVDLEAASHSPLGVATAASKMEDGRTALDLLVFETQNPQARLVTHLAVGVPHAEVVRVASEMGADCIVVGTRDRGRVKRMLLGSVATRVMHGASCPVFVVREKKPSADATPEIAPPCPECLAVRAGTGRAELWCARHAQKHTRGHLHYEYPASYGLGSMLVRP